jgi:hypothetical protein
MMHPWDHSSASFSVKMIIERVALTGSAVNRNNITGCNPFIVTDLMGGALTAPASVSATACAECDRVFESFSKLYAHKAKPCVVRDEDLKNPVQVRFPVDQVMMMPTEQSRGLPHGCQEFNYVSIYVFIRVCMCMCVTAVCKLD